MFLTPMHHLTPIKRSGHNRTSRMRYLNPRRATSIILQQHPKMTYLLTSVLVCLYLTPMTYAQQFATLSAPHLHAPNFIKNMNEFVVKENTPVGEHIYTLEAQAPAVGRHQPYQILYGIEGTQLFAVDKTTGQIRVAQPIDRELTSDSVTFRVNAKAVYNTNSSPDQPTRLETGPLTQLTITVLIIDENDNPPKVEQVRIGGTSYDSEELTRQTTSNILRAVGNMPGSFTKSPLIKLNLSESTPVGSIVVDVIEAVDVDKASTEPLRSICFNCEPEFELVSATDNLLNDRLNTTLKLVDQLVHVPRNNVRQLHVIVNDGKYNSSIVFEITIEDVQNRPPQFIGSTTFIVNERAPIDSVIATIQAIDGDVTSPEDLVLFGASNLKQHGRPILFDFISPTGTSTSTLMGFKLHPLTGQLQVADRLDREMYLSSNGVLGLRARARELFQDVELDSMEREDLYESLLSKLTSKVDPSSEAQSEAEITIILADTNDNAPHWLNSTEISTLNMNESPVWYNNLPSDRDGNRMYQLYVRENSLAGTPITLHNEMFVYDLDSGDNAEFNVSLVNSFNLFDVEPKQVSGFALVTLKLASTNGDRTKLLDYENVNERSFIIQLSATETRTGERFTSKAQIQINVLDVNDNAPLFRETSYTANIREDAAPGKTVTLVQATDKDEVSKQLFYSLHGQSSYLFDINHKTGLVTIARCSQTNENGNVHLPQPANMRSRSSSTRQCIDFEQQRAHHLMIEASDGELSTKVPLTVFIDDANDNPPVFTLPIIDVVIEEGSDRFEPPVRIEVKDIDQTSVPTYSIIEGNFEGLFSINNLTGELQLTRPIRIAHDELASSNMQLDFRQQQQPMNKMTLIVQASDGVFLTNATVRIDVLDSNDNAPKFLRPHYNAEIADDAAPGQTITTVRAIDSDRGNNARVSYKLERGSHSQFEVDETTGMIRVAQNAKEFDARKMDNFTLVIAAYDHSTAPKSSTVTVMIKVLNSRRRAPEFNPKVQRATVSENTPNNTIFHRMTLTTDSSIEHTESSLTQLVFEPGPIEALDKDGQQVAESERLETMFSVSTNTGDVVVSSTLDHNYASYVNLTIFVSSRQIQNYSISPELIQDESAYIPRSVGYLIINVADDNTNPPIFAAPWTPQQPELSYQMIEELPVGSILTQLVASDADSKISYFKIDPPNEYFELTSPQTGTIINKKIIDYDMLMSQNFMTPASLLHHHHHHGGHHRSAALTASAGVPNNVIQFNVVAYDSGWPQLSARATISVEIVPTNDWDCKFDQSIYEVRVKENPLPDMLIVQVRASDLDFGEQHNTIRYQLVGEHRDLFNIDPRTGLVTVSSKGSVGLDRERLGQSNFTLIVIGKDETTSSTSASTLSNQFSSTLTISQKPNKHNLSATSARICSAALKIQVEDVNDNPALFSQRVYETTAYDTDSPDVPLIKLFVRDEDSASQTKSSGTSNTFTILSGNTQQRFNITSSGLIYATKPLNETMMNSNGQIQLRVQVLQQSQQSSSNAGIVAKFTDECIVRINFSKMNRFSPEWRYETLKSAMVKENAKQGTLVAQLQCFDRDYEAQKNLNRGSLDLDFESDQNKQLKIESSSELISPIRYWLKVNGTNILETNEFKIDTMTGNLYTRVELDRETQEYYQLIVACEDNGKPQSLVSIAPLFVIVLDEDDNLPEFIIPKAQQQAEEAGKSLSKKNRLKIPSLRFLTEEHQSRGIPVGQLKAIDRDIDIAKPLLYCILEGNDFQEFNLDRITGILYTNSSLDREKQSTYDLLVTAINDGSSCETRIAAHNQPLESPESKIMMRKISSSREIVDEYRSSLVAIQIDVLDINDNAPVFKRQTYRAGAHQRSSMGTIITQVTAFDPDFGLNGTLNYRISEILMYKTNPSSHSYYSQSRKFESTADQPVLSKPIKLVQYPFKIDQHGNVYTQQLLSQYQLMSMFVLQIDATEQAEPWRTASTKLEVYLYETSSQLKIRINLHPRLIAAHKSEIEALLSNATKYNAIINRARSYYGTTDTSNSKHKLATSSTDAKNVPTLDLTTSNNNNNVPSSINNNPYRTNSDEQNSFSNIHLIFVDNFRIVNPNLVIEKFDLTSSQLFTPQTFLNPNNNQENGRSSSGDVGRDSQSTRQQMESIQKNEVSSLIDKIALASIEAAHYHADPSSGGFSLSADWLENPAVIFVCLASLLVSIGFMICIVGCCCTSRIKDHIIKVAMGKLVKQQNMQAKINERVLAAANAAAANGNPMAGQDYMLPHGAFMSSSFDTTKGCINNNNENMSILQQATNPGEFLPDPNYSTLNGHMNLGAHYYDASKLEQNDDGDVHQQHETNINGDLIADRHNLNNGSIVSLSMVEQNVDLEGEDLDERQNFGKNSSHLFGNGTSMQNVSSQKQRQQVPNNQSMDGNNNI